MVVEGDTVEPFKLCRMLIAPWYKATFTRLSTRHVLITSRAELNVGTYANQREIRYLKSSLGLRSRWRREERVKERKREGVILFISCVN